MSIEKEKVARLQALLVTDDEETQAADVVIREYEEAFKGVTSLAMVQTPGGKVGYGLYREPFTQTSSWTIMYVAESTSGDPLLKCQPHVRVAAVQYLPMLLDAVLDAVERSKS